ncbi:hypothetical protein V6Z11_D11G208100 [Gossypium hirsutum]
MTRWTPKLTKLAPDPRRWLALCGLKKWLTPFGLERLSCSLKFWPATNGPVRPMPCDPFAKPSKGLCETLKSTTFVTAASCRRNSHHQPWLKPGGAAVAKRPNEPRTFGGKEQPP